MKNYTPCGSANDNDIIYDLQWMEDNRIRSIEFKNALSCVLEIEKLAAKNISSTVYVSGQFYASFK